MARSEPYAKGYILWGMPGFIDAKGGNSAQLLTAAELPISEFTTFDQPISFRKVENFMENAARALNMPDFGINYIMSMPAHLPNMTPFILLAKFEKDCRGWLLAVQKYLKIHTNGFQFLLHETPDSETASLRYVSDAVSQYSRQMNESMLARIIVAVRRVTGHTDQSPLLVRFRNGPHSSDMSSYEKCFGCPIEFNAEHNEIVFERKILDYSTHGNLTLLKSLLSVYVGFQMARMSTFHSSTATMVSLAISGALGTGLCNIAYIADSLDMSAKKLQRNLTDEGTSFSEILEEVRKNSACNMLIESDVSITHIANMLDYAGLPPFTLAFRRWTGQSPLEYRKRNKVAPV